MLPSTIWDRVDPDAVFEPTHVADANSADSCNTHKEIKMKCKKIFRFLIRELGNAEILILKSEN